MKTLTETQIDALTPEQLNGLTVLAKGFTMLAKVAGGKKYRLEHFKSKAYGDCVTFFTPKGQRGIVSHNAYSVISAIQNCSNGYLNGLELE